MLDFVTGCLCDLREVANQQGRGAAWNAIVAPWLRKHALIKMGPPKTDLHRQGRFVAWPGVPTAAASRKMEIPLVTESVTGEDENDSNDVNTTAQVGHRDGSNLPAPRAADGGPLWSKHRAPLDNTTHHTACCGLYKHRAIHR